MRFMLTFGYTKVVEAEARWNRLSIFAESYSVHLDRYVRSQSGLEVLEMEKLDNYLRIKEAAEYLGVSQNTLRNWGRDGKIIEHRHPMNNYRLYKKSDLTRLLRLANKPRA